MKPIKAYIISHTHWDREWYLPFEKMKVKLIDLIDALIDILENDRDYYAFLMDGQTIVLEDYLEVKPQNEKRLKNLIASGKMQIGPWYILPDELLISGESHIRNFIEGKRISARFGGGMKAGYLPDSFGHPAQMPQILKGLGMDNIVFWRGASHAMDMTEFKWQAVDGSEVLALHMPFGYGNSARLSDDMSRTVPRIKKLIEELSSLSTAGIVLLMNGSDHILPQRNLPDVIKKLNNELTGIEIRHSTLDEYVDEIRKNHGKLKTFMGELRYTHRSLLLGGTLSARMYLKQRNHEVEKGMERYVEPFCSLDKLTGGKYPTELIIRGWKSILENHPHDSICGCSVDSVHREMMARFDKVQQLEDELLTRAMKSIAQRSKPQFEFDACVTVFNPVQEERKGYMEVDVDFDRTLVMEVNFDKSILEEYEDRISHPEPPEWVLAYDSHGNRLNAVLLSAWKDYEMKKSDETLPEIYKVNRCRIGIYVDKLPPLGYSTLYFKKTGIKAAGIDSCGARIENEYYLVEVEPSGTILVKDKETGKVYSGCNRFLDGGDAGDEYTYSYPAKDGFYGLDASSLEISGSKWGEFMQQIVIKGVLNLPESLNSDRKARSGRFVACPVKIEVRLEKGVKRVSFKTELVNNAKDHRLQVLFPSGVLACKSYSESQFAVIERSIEAEQVEKWEEQPPVTHPQKGFVDVSDGVNGAAIINCGLPEFEVKNDEGQSWIALTLLRCVGWLSRGDLLTRKGNGGWTIETPDAQCLGAYSFEYAFMPHAGTWEDAEVYAVSDEFNHPVKYIQVHEFSGDNPDSMSLIEHMPGEWRISAVKQAEDGNGYIIRFFNISMKPVIGRIKFGFNIACAEEVTLDERKLCEIASNGREITFGTRQGEIRTIRIRLDDIK